MTNDPRRVTAPRPLRRIPLGVFISGLMLIAVCATVLTACGVAGRAAVAGEASDLAISSAISSATSSAVIVAAESGSMEAVATVHVVGAVASAGVYVLPQGSRVTDAIATAGGATPGADVSLVNLARVVIDGEQIRVPVLGESISEVTAVPSNSAAVGPVNLNTATQEQLESLPRVGPAMAQRILDYRQENGGFRSVDELRNVSGIGEKTFAALVALVTV